MIQVILILAVLMTIVLLAKFGGLEAIINGFLAIVGFIGSLILSVFVIACLCIAGVIIIPIIIIIVICIFITELFDKVRGR